MIFDMLNVEFCPIEIQKYLINKKIKENLVGCDSSKVYKVTDNNDLSFYLKIKKKTDNNDLKNEYDKTLWLNNKLSVPKVLHYLLFDNKEFFLMEEVKGQMSCAFIYLESPEKIITLISKELKKIHSIDIQNCPFKENLDIKIRKAKYNVDNNFVDESDFNFENIGKTSIELFHELLTQIPEEEDLVLTHGDYCMPNIIINNNEKVSFIDLGRFGIADRYQDIALILRSIVYNFKTESYNDLFLSEYGIKEINYKKIKFYNLLDEFF